MPGSSEGNISNPIFIKFSSMNIASQTSATRVTVAEIYFIVKQETPNSHIYMPKKFLISNRN
jgi:hypothetical protein